MIRQKLFKGLSVRLLVPSSSFHAFGFKVLWLNKHTFGGRIRISSHICPPVSIFGVVNRSGKCYNRSWNGYLWKTPKSIHIIHKDKTTNTSCTWKGKRSVISYITFRHLELTLNGDTKVYKIRKYSLLFKLVIFYEK